LTLFPPQLGAPVRAWRIDLKKYARTWDSGIGAYAVGGRWNPKGVKTVYCSLDAATAVIEVALHKGFRALVAIPSAASRQRWNLMFDPDRAGGLYQLAIEEQLAIDTRLKPPAP
jgi:RES domain-containing protein